MKYDGLHPADRLREVAEGVVDQLRRTDPGGEPVTGWSDDQLERIADNMATQAAYVRDQLEDRPAPWRREGPADRAAAGMRTQGKITRAIRKALGYSYP